MKRSYKHVKEYVLCVLKSYMNYILIMQSTVNYKACDWYKCNAEEKCILKLLFSSAYY